MRFGESAYIPEYPYSYDLLLRRAELTSSVVLLSGIQIRETDARGESWLALIAAATLPVGPSATGKGVRWDFRMRLRDRGSSPAPESLPTPSMSHRRWVDHHPRSFLLHASAQAMRRALAPSAAPIALIGATAIASALATQRLSSALDAAALRRIGAITLPPAEAARNGSRQKSSTSR